MTQNNGDASVNGGLDVEFDSGFYVGTWGSNVSFGGDCVVSEENHKIQMVSQEEFDRLAEEPGSSIIRQKQDRVRPSFLRNRDDAPSSFLQRSSKHTN